MSQFVNTCKSYTVNEPHDEVGFNGDSCPVCVIKDDMVSITEERDVLEGQVEELKSEIEALNEDE